jgi:hypothetical protein
MSNKKSEECQNARVGQSNFRPDGFDKGKLQNGVIEPLEESDLLE